MPSVNYDQVYSRFYTKVKAYDLVDLEESLANELLCNWLHSSVFYPMIRKLFSSVAMNDEQKMITYSMEYTIDDDSDKEFVLEILADEMLLKWIGPKVTNLTTVSQYFGTSESKFFSQSNHLAELINLRDMLERDVRSLIADRGGQNNTFLDGTSAMSTMRSTS